jgi:hypothetical protein
VTPLFNGRGPAFPRSLTNSAFRKYITHAMYMKRALRSKRLPNADFLGMRCNYVTRFNIFYLAPSNG